MSCAQPDMRKSARLPQHAPYTSAGKVWRCHRLQGLLLQIMRVRSVEEYEFHMCPNEDYAWDHIPRAVYAEHSQDTCPQCAAHRFLQDTLKPAKVRLPSSAGLVLSLTGQKAIMSQGSALHETLLHGHWPCTTWPVHSCTYAYVRRCTTTLGWQT